MKRMTPYLFTTMITLCISCGQRDDEEGTTARSSDAGTDMVMVDMNVEDLSVDMSVEDQDLSEGVDMNMVTQDMRVDAAPGPCTATSSSLDFKREASMSQGGGSLTHQLEVPDVMTSQDSLGARLRDGKLEIFLDMPRKPGDFRLETTLLKAPGPDLPMTYCLDDPINADERCEGRDDVALSTLSVYTSEGSSGLGNVQRGQLVLETCPSKQGDRVIGRFEDVRVELGLGDFTATTFEGEFNVVLFESDESWNCDAVSNDMCRP